MRLAQHIAWLAWGLGAGLVGWSCAAQADLPAGVGAYAARADNCGVEYGIPASNGRGKAYFPSYLDDSFAQLKAAAPALIGANLDKADSIDPEAGLPILDQAGEVISDMLARVPRLTAKEELMQAAVSLPYLVAGGVARSAQTREVAVADLEKLLDTRLREHSRRYEFSYRIQTVPDPSLGSVLAEYRTTGSDQAVDTTKIGQGSPQGVGFGSSWLMFEKENRKQLRFRYLGRQKVGKHQTFVVAFAQIPDKVVLPALIALGGNSCHYYEQGLMWIDQTVFQIVRLQTDLLAPVPRIHLNELRSDIHFGEIKIPERNLTLWMPSEVEITWRTDEQAAAELHRYSNYRLFTATSRIVLP